MMFVPTCFSVMSIIRWRCAAVERREMSRNTEFSIIIIACDVEPYIEQCIASVRRQTLPDFEAVVGIEASADGTGEAALRAVGGDVRFRIVDLPRSGSASCVRNYGIRHATGEYLFFSTGTTGSRRMLWNSFMRRWRDMDRPI